MRCTEMFTFNSSNCSKVSEQGFHFGKSISFLSSLRPFDVIACLSNEFDRSVYYYNGKKSGNLKGNSGRTVQV